MTLPLSKLDLLAGYGNRLRARRGAAGVDHLSGRVGLLGLDVEGSVWVVLVLAVCNALLGVALGLLASAFAQTEFQRCSSLPAFVLPQFLLCGLLVPRERMAEALEWVSYALPLSWAFEGLQEAVVGGSTTTIVRDAAIVLGTTVVASRSCRDAATEEP